MLLRADPCQKNLSHKPSGRLPPRIRETRKIPMRCLATRSTSARELALSIGSSCMTIALTCWSAISTNVRSNSAGPATSKGCTCRLDAGDLVQFLHNKIFSRQIVAFKSTAALVKLGFNSLSNSRRLAASSGLKKLRPVMFPPGRERLATSPRPVISATAVMTMGIVAVAFWSARAPGAACVSRTSGLNSPIPPPTRGAARTLPSPSGDR